MHKFSNVDCTKCKTSNCIVAKYCSFKWQQRINNFKTVVFYKKNQPIVKEQTTAMGIYIVHSGKVLIISERKNSGRQIIRLAIEGDILEHKSSKDKLSSPFTAEAFKDSEICYIPKEAFFQLLNEEPQLTIHLEQMYTNKFIRAEMRLKNAMIMSSGAKVADALLFLSDSFEGDIPFSRNELSELTGISTKRVNSELRKLTDDGIIGLAGKKKKIVINDLSKLLNMVQEYDTHYSENLKNVSNGKK